MSKFNKNTNLKRYVLFIASLASFVAVPAMAAILVQNFMTFNLEVQDAPIIKLAGADAAQTDFLTVDLGQTIENQDDADGTGTDTFLSNEIITFTCFTGDRVYYTDVIQLQNTSTELWDVNLLIESQLTESQTTGDLTTTGLDTGDETVDIWLYPSEVNTATSVVGTRPNPNLLPLDDWYDNQDDTTEATPNTAAPVNANPLQIEATNNGTATTISVLTRETGKFPIPAGEQRQLALVADCSPEVANGDTITFNVTVEATPNGQANF